MKMTRNSLQTYIFDNCLFGTIFSGVSHQLETYLTWANILYFLKSYILKLQMVYKLTFNT